MSEEQSKPLVVFLALLPIGLLLIIEFFAESLQSAEKLIPHLAFGVLIAQLLCLVAFIKGENLSRTTRTFNQSKCLFCTLLVRLAWNET